MSGAKTPLHNAYADTDVDFQGYKALNVDLGAVSSGFPVSDAVAMVKNASDPTKLMRFNLAGLSTEVTRVFVLPNYDGQFATLAGTERFTNKTYNGLALLTGTSGLYTINVNGDLTLDSSFDVAGGHVSLVAEGTCLLGLPVGGGDLATEEFAQPRSSSLITLSGLTSTLLGQNFLTFPLVPGAIKFVRINADNSLSALTAAQMLTALGTGAPFSDAAGLVKGSLDSSKMVRFEVDTNVPTLTTRVMTVPPIDGTLALVAGTIPASALNTNKTLKPFSDTDVPSQLAVYEFVKARAGLGHNDSSDDTIASDTIVDLDTTTGPQVEVTGSVPIAQMLLSEGDERVVVFSGAPILTNSSSLRLPGGVDIPIRAGDYAVLRGGSSWTDVLLIQSGAQRVASHRLGSIDELDYLGLNDKDNGAGNDLQLRSAGARDAARLLSFNVVDGDRAATIGGDLVFIGDFRVTGDSVHAWNAELNLLGDTVLHLPTTGTVATGLSNASSSAQTPAASTRTYLAGSSITIPVSKMKIGSKFRWRLNLTKTAAGTASSTIDVAVGTAGSTADTARLSFTKPAGTAAVDEGVVEIEVVVRGPLSSSGVIVGEMTMIHNLASTGHMTVPSACVSAVSSTFDVTTAGLIVGLCLTPGASDAITIQQVSAEAINI